MKDVKTKENLENKLSEEIMSKKQMNAESVYIDHLLEEIGKGTDAEFPTELIDAEINRMLEQYAEKLKMQGITLEQYLEFTKSTMDDLKATLKDEANKNVLYRNIIEEVLKLENITVSEKEINEETERLAKLYKMEKEELLKAFGGTDMVKYDLEMRKTLEFLKENN